MERFLRIDEVAERTGLSRSTIQRQTKQGAFPQKRQITAQRTGWLESEIDAYLQQLPEA